MPQRPPRLCSTCRRLHSESRCPRCTPESWSTSKRGGSTRAWRRLRLAVFAEQSYICNIDGCRSLCEELDHIIGVALGGTDERDNVQGLCLKHHAEKTQREARDAQTRHD